MTLPQASIVGWEGTLLNLPHSSPLDAFDRCSWTFVGTGTWKVKRTPPILKRGCALAQKVVADKFQRFVNAPSRVVTNSRKLVEA